MEAPKIRTDVRKLDIDIRKSAFVTSLDSYKRILISCSGIDQIQQRFTALKPAQVVTEQIDDLIPMIRPNSGRVRGDDDVRHCPQRARRIQRLALEYIENGSAQPSVAKCVEKRWFVNDPASMQIFSRCYLWEPN